MPSSTPEAHHRHRIRRNAPPRYLSRSQRKILFFFLKCMVMVAVISIFLFFLGFAAFVLLHFLFMSNTFHRRCARFFRPRNAAVSPSTAAESEAFPSLLPDVAYYASSFPGTSDCAICLDPFREGDGCRNLPVCKHLFHAKCVDRWIRKKPTCPVCRTRVDLDPAVVAGSRINGEDRWKRLWVVDFDEGTSY